MNTASIKGTALTEIAQALKDAPNKVQLIYAFNGNGKTRLSREFKLLLDSENGRLSDDGDHSEKVVLYYNSFTEDLFYWDNDLENNADLKLRIHPNDFKEWIFKDQGEEGNIISNFQSYTNEFLMPEFNNEYSEVTFSLKRGNDEGAQNIKISKGEESIFIWSIFYSLLDQVIATLNTPDPSDRETVKFDNLQYVFIDDPVTSLDENHLLQLAVDLAQLIKKSESALKFIITKHSTVFYNLLHNELNTKTCYLLKRQEDNTFVLEGKKGSSNRSFFYHLHLKKMLEEAIANNQIEKYHFMLLRNLYEKTASFFGFEEWKELLPAKKENYYNRIIQFTSHSTLVTESIAEPSPAERETIKFLFNHLIDNYYAKQTDTKS